MHHSLALAQILIPLVMGAVVFALPSERGRTWLLPVNGLVHLVLTGIALTVGGAPEPGSWLALDPAGRIVLLGESVLYLMCAFYTVGYLAQRTERPNRVFSTCLAFFPGMMSLICWSHHLGLMWVALEAATLVCGPMIYFNKTARSIEASWKYLLVGSVGIAMALLGSFFLAYAALYSRQVPSLLFDDLMRMAPGLSRPWLHAAFVLILVGYGTKMGLAPMHTWKPDAYGEAPGLVGALMAGAVTNGAFLAILRIFQILQAAGEGRYARGLLMFMGLLSMGVAAVFMLRQRDFKRMLAYSSVEHMGILAVGVGLGGAASFGLMLHVLNNGLSKGVLFLSAGNVHRAYGSKLAGEVSGALVRIPVSAALLTAGFFAITGSPPFGPFVSEFTIVSAAFSHGELLAGTLFLVFLAIIFVGMGATLLPMLFGDPPEARTAVEGDPLQGPGPVSGDPLEARTAVEGDPRESRRGVIGDPLEARTIRYRDTVLTALPILVLMGLVLQLGVFLPASLEGLLREAAASLEPAIAVTSSGEIPPR